MAPVLVLAQRLVPHVRTVLDAAKQTERKKKKKNTPPAPFCFRNLLRELDQNGSITGLAANLVHNVRVALQVPANHTISHPVFAQHGGC
jgi:hypothetical protein